LWHAGERNAASPYNAARQYGFQRTVSTATVYLVSAFFYGEVYIWSCGAGARLGFTEEGRLHERIKLNERPIYLRFMFSTLALYQAGQHMYFDYDRIDIYVGKKLSQLKDPRTLLLNEAPGYLRKSATYAVIALVVGSVLYFPFFRYIWWDWSYSFARRLISLGKTSKPTGLSPFLPLVGRFLIQGTLLVLLWQITNKAFSFLLAQEPLKKGKPLTSDSKDPNGSLINGLKTRKLEVKSAAFWELAIITGRFEERRKTMFDETNRKKGATIKLITEQCLAEIKGIVERINQATNPSAPAAQAAPKPLALSASTQRIAQPLKQGQIMGPGEPLETRLQWVEQAASQIARTHSSPQNAQNALAREYLKKGQQKAIEGAQQAETAVKGYKEHFATSWPGRLFRYTVRRAANGVIFDTPYSKRGIILNAVIALTNLTVFSLKEDGPGQFQYLVPDIIRGFTAAIKSIEAYMQSLEVHWTDVDTLAKPEGERKKVEEVDELVAELKSGLSKQLGAFVEYLEGMGMSRLEIQEAKKLVVREVPEVVQVR
jgi:nucleoporin NDC1